MSGRSKQAEKEYLARTGSSAWERVKPFSQPGADTLADSAQMLHDFAVAMMALQPSRDDLILDVGAGGCWCSDLLGQLNRRSVAVDISLDMLRTGRSRQNGPGIRAVAGDLEALPFRSGTFQKAVCFSAIHHVPSIPLAVAEISRVLTDDGVALFSEPGRGHAQAPVSEAAMRDFGVVEQDVIVADFARACRQAGFTDVRIKTLAYAVPSFDLTPEQWDSWTRLADSKRPMRALRKIANGALEFFGAGKRTTLFEETFGISLVRILRRAIEDHPVIIASKKVRESAAPSSSAYRAIVRVIVIADQTSRESVAVRARVTNTGTSAWKASIASTTGLVRLGVQVLDGAGRLVKRDHHRVALPADVAPGESADMAFTCPLPDIPDDYTLKFDMVAEGVTWFEQAGSTAAVHRCRP